MNSFFAEALKNDKRKAKGEEILNLLRSLSSKEERREFEEQSWSYEPSFSLEEPVDGVGKARIVIIGVGGAGCNTANTLMELGVKGAEVIAVNTDFQHLQRVKAHKKVLIGKSITNGLGAGGSPELARACAENDASLIAEALGNRVDLAFVAAGMGGGTGTGASPVVARIAREKGARVIGVVTLPFKAEQRLRMKVAMEGVKQLRKYADTVVLISNDKLLSLAGPLPIQDAFRIGDYTLAVMVKGITEIINKKALVNVDLQDVRNVMAAGGVSAVGIGESDHPNHRATEAVKMALENQLIDISTDGATGALIVVTGGPSMKLSEVTEIAEYVTNKMDPNAVIKIGADIDPNLGEKIRVILLLSGISSPQILPGSPEPIKRPLSWPMRPEEDIEEMVVATLGQGYTMKFF
ncbi:MAG: cell division protein FtsZ [Candidatus Methanodesulfokora sp.]